jgi:hypothetical protein
MSAAKDPAQAKSVIDKVRSKFTTAKSKWKAGLGEGVKEQLKIVLDPANEIHFAGIIARFSYRNGSGCSWDDLMSKMSRSLVRDSVAEAVLLHALGWTKKRIDELIEKSKPANIGVDEFRAEATSFYTMLNTQLYLPILSGTPSDEDIKNEHKVRTYVRQMKIIEASDDELTTAAIDFLTAKASVIQYARLNLINSLSFKAYDTTLKRIWQNRKKAIELEGNSGSEVHFGQRLANECLCENARLQGLDVPISFTSGCFHALADVLEIGWHPHYAKVLLDGNK